MNNEIQRTLAEYLRLLSTSAKDYEVRAKIDYTYNQIALVFQDIEEGDPLDTLSVTRIALELRKLSDALTGSPLTQKLIVKILFELLNYSLTSQYRNYSYKNSGSNYNSSKNSSSSNYSFYDDDYNFNDNYNYNFNSKTSKNYSDINNMSDEELEELIRGERAYSSGCKTNYGGKGFNVGYDVCSKDSLLFKSDYKDEQTKKRLIQVVNAIVVASIELVPFLIKTFMEKRWESNSGNC